MSYLAGGPVWDDISLIFGYLATLDVAGIGALWLHPVGGGEVGAGYYRPLAMTVISILSRGGMLPLHVASIALHAGSAALIAYLLRDRPSARGAALVFAVHPLCSEVLGWASALPDALAVHLGLWACFLGGRGRWVVATAALIAGVLCKETALLIPAAALAGGLLPRNGWRWWAGAVVVALAARAVAGTGAGWAIAGKIGLAPVALGWLVGGVLWPFPLTAVRELHVAPLWAVPFGVAVLVALAIGVWRAAPGARRLGLAGAALVLAGPALALPPTLHGYMAAERYMYPALVGLAFWWAASVRRVPRAVWLAVLGAGVAVHATRAASWRSHVTLFEAAVTAYPTSSFAWHNLGHGHRLVGDHSAAADAFEAAVDAGHPHPADALLCLESMVRAGEARRAVHWAETRAGATVTADWLAWWARALADSGDHAAARARLAPLLGPTGWAGPEFVPALAAEIGL